jgi:hypothetical protein
MIVVTPDANDVIDGVTEVLAYGTAVVVEEVRETLNALKPADAPQAMSARAAAN